jgi:hypothetical protein
MKYLENPPINKRDEDYVNNMVNEWIDLIGQRELILNKLWDEYGDTQDDDADKVMVLNYYAELNEINESAAQINHLLQTDKIIY